MYQPVALFIGLRYMRGRAVDRFGRFVSALYHRHYPGVMALVTVLSVMNGFERELQNNILGLMPQAILLSMALLTRSNSRKRQSNWTALIASHLLLPVMWYCKARAAWRSGDARYRPGAKRSTNAVSGQCEQTDLEPEYNVILGEQLASQLGVNRGDQIRVMVPSASQFTPMGRIPSQRLFNVIGTFAANSEVDGYEMLVNIEDASRLMRYPAANITGWRLWLDEPLRVDSLSQQKLPKAANGRTGVTVKASCSRPYAWKKI